jgi:hypothetical protein
MAKKTAKTWQTDQAEYRADQRVRRIARLQQRGKAIFFLREEGFVVEQLSTDHYRINRRLDLFPLHNTWEDRATGKRGGAKDLVLFVREWRKS